MPRLALAMSAAVALSACSGPEVGEFLFPVSDKAQACFDAETVGASYGTPENRGPCWGDVVSTASAYGVRSYVVRIVGSQYGVAALTYDERDELVVFSESF